MGVFAPRDAIPMSRQTFLRTGIASEKKTALPDCSHLPFSTSGHSPQAPSRHMKRLAYRCFLPDLTGFTRLHCARPKRCGPTWKRDKKMAESERFELSVRYQRTHDFQSCSFNHSDNSPQCSTKEAILLSVATPTLQHESLYQSKPFLSIGESKFFQEATGDFERAFFVMLSVKLAIGLHLW